MTQALGELRSVCAQIRVVGGNSAAENSSLTNWSNNPIKEFSQGERPRSGRLVHRWSESPRLLGSIHGFAGHAVRPAKRYEFPYLVVLPTHSGARKYDFAACANDARSRRGFLPSYLALQHTWFTMSRG
jgi:hypothetical protein